jgi:hypothetical protein
LAGALALSHETADPEKENAKVDIRAIGSIGNSLLVVAFHGLSAAFFRKPAMRWMRKAFHVANIQRILRIKTVIENLPR